MTLWRLLLPAKVLFLTSGCGAGVYVDACPDSQYPGEGARTFVVDPVSGVDEVPPPGTCRRAKTVSFLLAQLAQANVQNVDVILEGGTYSAEAEQFPIVVPSGIRVIGSELASAGPAIIVGDGPYTTFGNVGYSASVVLQGSAQLRNVQVQSSSVALLLDETTIGASVQSIRITACVRGLLAVSQSVARVSSLHVEGCSGAGIETHDTSAPEFSKSTIVGNAVGVIALDSSQPKFGSGAAGANTFAANVLCDFKSSSTATLDAVDNTWDDNVFEFFPSTQCETGENLVLQGMGTVIYQYFPRQGAPMFPATGLIGLLQPDQNAFIPSSAPAFVWSAGSRSRNVALAVWTSRPDLGPVGIRNSKDIVLFWHSGLQTGSVGYVRFEDMRTPVGGDIRILESSLPLTPGRPYYWAVWEWDEMGINVEYSSEVRAFSIRF